VPSLSVPVADRDGGAVVAALHLSGRPCSHAAARLGLEAGPEMVLEAAGAGLGRLH